MGSGTEGQSSALMLRTLCRLPACEMGRKSVQEWRGARAPRAAEAELSPQGGFLVAGHPYTVPPFAGSLDTRLASHGAWGPGGGPHPLHAVSA